MTKNDYLKQIDTVIENGKYKTDWQSLSGRKTPDWYYKGKFGIFIHWGLYSMPARHEWIRNREEIDDADEMAEDSISEFLNVVNGLFVVDLGKRDLDLDLETPRVRKNKHPMGSRQLQLCVDTGFGSFELVMAADEFALGEKPN